MSLESKVDDVQGRGLSKKSTIARLRHELSTTKEELERTKEENKKLRIKSKVCSVTGLLTRETFIEIANSFTGLLAKPNDRRTVSSFVLAVMFIDVDNFKTFNDEYGHKTGDRVLRLVAEAVQCSLRTTDVVGRYGGEEIVAALPNIRGKNAAVLAERVRRAVASIDIEGIPQITVSIGVACTKHTSTIAALLDHADKVMYQAKRRGKNQSVFRGINPDGTCTDLPLDELSA